MDSDTISMQLGIIGETAGLNNKIEALVTFNSPLMRKILKLTYDTGISFGIQKTTVETLPFAYAGEDLPLDDQAFELLDALSKREYRGKVAYQKIQDARAKLSPESTGLFDGILSKTHAIGLSAIGINKAIPGLIPIYPYMRCSTPKEAKLDTWDWASGIISQLKCDGMFVEITVGDEVTVCTRSGENITSAVPELVKEARVALLAGFRYHGELQVMQGETLLPRAAGNGIINSLVQDGEAPGYTPVAFLWDMVGKDPEVYIDRWQDLRELVASGGPKYLKAVQTVVVHSEKEAHEHFLSVRKRGLEGTIVKTLDMLWKHGTSRQQVKMKAVMDNTMEIVGFTEGSGLFKGMIGALCCQSSDGRVACNVSGFTINERKDFSDNKDNWLGVFVDVSHNGLITNKGTTVQSLQNPRFSKVRRDKLEADTLSEF